MKFNFLHFKKKNLLKDKIYDFIIIGSGPSAITLYKKLLSKKKNSKILVIERGNFEKKLFKKVKSKHLKIKLKSRVFTVGGTSSLWSNISSYFEEFEMQPRWTKKKGNLWPMRYESLIREYGKLNNEYEFFFNMLKKKKINIPFELRPFIATTKPINFKRFINKNEIDLIYNCKINSINESSKTSIAYTSNNDAKFVAKKIIICCGGIESINLIQNSVSKGKLKNIKNKTIIGKYFMDHPKFNLGYLKYPKVHIINKLELTQKNNKIFYHGVSLPKDIQRKKKLLNSYVRFEKTNNRIFRFLEKFNIPLMKKIMIRNNTYRVRLFCEMIPNVKNSIISKKNNTYVKLKLSKIDIDTIRELSTRIKNFFSLKPKLELNFNINNIQKKIECASHHMGGLRFDNKNKLSFVDKNLKIRGLKNTYVCGSAVFPSSGSVNPTMTICALSSRLGEHLTKN